MAPTEKKLDDLQARIDKARANETAAQPSKSSAATTNGLGAALRLSSELVAGVVVGGGLGYFFDKAVGSSPFGLIGFLLLGFAAGTMNLVRAASRRTNGAGSGPESGSGTGSGG